MFCNFYLVKNHKIAKNSTTTEAKEEIGTDLKNLWNFRKILMQVQLNLKIIKFYLIKLATDFYCQPSYLQDKRASLCYDLNFLARLIDSILEGHILAVQG